MSHRNKIILAVVFALFAALFFSIMNALTKIARTEVSTSMSLFFRFAIGFIITIPFFMGFKNFSFKTKNYMMHLLRVITALGGFACLLYSIKFLPVINVTLLGITYPLFIPFLVYFFYRKQISLKMALGLVLGFIGVIFVLQPDATRFIETHSLIALTGGFLIALSILVVRVLHITETPEQIGFYYLLQAAIISTLIALFDWQLPSAKMWPIVVGIGITGTIYQQCFVYALRFAHASLVSPIMYSSIIFSALIELTYWEMIPNQTIWFGFGLIFVGACITVWIEGQQDKLTRR